MDKTEMAQLIAEAVAGIEGIEEMHRADIAQGSQEFSRIMRLTQEEILVILGGIGPKIGC